MSGNNHYSKFELDGIVNSRLMLIRKLLLHNEASRKQLAAELGISLPSATNHTQDLLNHSFLISCARLTGNAKRPTQMLKLNRQAGTCALFRLNSFGVAAETLGLDGSVQTTETLTAIPTQVDLFRALNTAFAHVNSHSILITADGLVSSPQGLVFSLSGVPDWVACAPGGILPAAAGHPSRTVASKIHAQTRGLAKQLGCDHGICLISFRNGELRLGVMMGGHLMLGHIGTPGNEAHVGVNDGAPCYCGRPNCFNAGLKQGKITPIYLAEGLRIILKTLGVQQVGLDFGEQRELSADTAGLLEIPVTLCDGDEAYRIGSRMLAVEFEWKHKLTVFFNNK